MTINRAVMEQRHSAVNALDYFPTYPWAVRAFCHHVFMPTGYTIDEPACGEGHLAEVLKEFGATVRTADIFPYGYGDVADFLAAKDGLFPVKYDTRPQYIITNPPFNKVQEFILRGLEVARLGVWVYCRLPLLETIERYEQLFIPGFLTEMWVYVERVPTAKGWCDPEGTSATAVAWFKFTKGQKATNRRATINFIPPCRGALELTQDYDLHWLPEVKRRERAQMMLAAAKTKEELEKAMRFSELVGYRP